MTQIPGLCDIAPLSFTPVILQLMLLVRRKSFPVVHVKVKVSPNLSWMDNSVTLQCHYKKKLLQMDFIRQFCLDGSDFLSIKTAVSINSPGSYPASFILLMSETRTEQRFGKYPRRSRAEWKRATTAVTSELLGRQQQTGPELCR